MVLLKLILGAALVCTASVTWAFDFKGLKPSSKPPSPLVRPLWGCSVNNDVEGGSHCINTAETIAGVPAESVFVEMKDGIIQSVSVTFSEGSFYRVSEAMIEKYGKPTKREEHVMENRMGARFPSKTFTWTKGDALMQLSQHWGKVDRSNLTVTSFSAQKTAEKDALARKKRNSNDL